MLSPSINDSKKLLTLALKEIMLLDGFSQTARSIMIGKLVPDPDWLPSVRNRVSMLSDAGGSWIADKPDIWAPVLLQFTDYATSLSSVATTARQGGISTAQQWIEVLNGVLVKQLDASVQATDITATALHAHYQAFKDIMPLLDESINAGWTALASEEQVMVKLAAELMHLQDVVNELADSITSADISTGQSVVTTTVKTLYTLVSEGAVAFSFLGMAASLYTVGKFYYDVITSSEEAAQTLQRIADLQTQASEEAQAAAGTKMVLQLLYNVERSFGQITDVVPQIMTLWSTERDKVKQAVSALEAGADPTSLMDLVTLPTADANWQAVNAFALAIPNLKTDVGPPVTLDPRHPLST